MTLYEFESLILGEFTVEGIIMSSEWYPLRNEIHINFAIQDRRRKPDLHPKPVFAKAMIAFDAVETSTRAECIHLIQTYILPELRKQYRQHQSNTV
jgi:hypothetical protein